MVYFANGFVGETVVEPCGAFLTGSGTRTGRFAPDDPQGNAVPADSLAAPLPMFHRAAWPKRIRAPMD